MMSSGLAEYSLFTATNKLEINIQLYGDPSSVFRGGTRGAVWNQREPTRHLAFSSFPSGLLHAVEHNGETRFLIVLHVWEYIWLSTQKRALGACRLLTNTGGRKLEVLAHFYTGVKTRLGKSVLFRNAEKKKTHKSETTAVENEWVFWQRFFGSAAANWSRRSQHFSPSRRQSNSARCCLHRAGFSFWTNWNQGKRVMRSADTL